MFCLLLLMMVLTNYGDAGGVASDIPITRPYCLSSGLRLAVPANSSKDVAAKKAVGVGKNRHIRLSVLVPVLHARVTQLRVAPSRMLLVSQVGGHCIETSQGRLSSVLPGSTQFSGLRGLLLDTSHPRKGTRLDNGRLNVPSLRETGIELCSFSSGRFTVAPARVSSECARMPLRRLLGVLAGL